LFLVAGVHAVIRYWIVNMNFAARQNSLRLLSPLWFRWEIRG